MKRILVPLLHLSAALAAPNITDFFLKGGQAISSFQDFTFQLEFNIFTTGGAQTTLQAMHRLRPNVGIFAAAGCAASYTELFDSDGFIAQMQYINSHMAWPRVSYLSRY